MWRFFLYSLWKNSKPDDSKKEDEEKRRYRLISCTFTNWLQAFAIMASVIGEKQPEHCSALFCYQDSIGEAYRVYGGTAWLRYDEQFWQRRAVRKELRWDHKDISLWMRLMTTTQAPNQFFQGGAVDLQHRDSRPETKKGCAGNITQGHASSEIHVGSSMSVQGAMEPIQHPDASNKARVAQGKLDTGGRTPVRVGRMRPFLGRYPDRRAAQLLEEGFAVGFRIPCSLAVVPPVSPNLRSALQHPDVVGEKLRKEVAMGRMAGPFSSAPLADLVVSPLGVVLKKEPNKFRLIHHLSFPKGGSVNDAIDQGACSVTYTSFDAAVGWVRRYGKGALLAKVDIESAFRLLPVHPESFRLLGCHWDDEFYVDQCLPMGCSISCAIFEQFSSFVEWVVRDVSGVNSIIHYLDDFLCIGPAESRICAVLLATLEHIADRFGIPLAPEKTEGPCTVITFLGIVLDSEAMECRLPEAKLADLKTKIASLIGLRKVQLRLLQSVLGKLNFACRICLWGGCSVAGWQQVRVALSPRDILYAWSRHIGMT